MGLRLARDAGWWLSSRAVAGGANAGGKKGDAEVYIDSGGKTAVAGGGDGGDSGGGGGDGDGGAYTPYVFQHFKVVGQSIPFFIIFTAGRGKRSHIYSPLAAIKHRRPHERISGCRVGASSRRRIISRSGIRRGRKKSPARGREGGWLCTLQRASDSRKK